MKTAADRECLAGKDLDEHMRCRICGGEFKGLTWFHLKYVHDIELSEYKRRLGVDYLWSASCRHSLSERARRRRRRSTYVPRNRAAITRDVKALARRYSPLTCSIVMRVDPPLFDQVQRVYAVRGLHFFLHGSARTDAPGMRIRQPRAPAALPRGVQLPYHPIFPQGLA